VALVDFLGFNEIAAVRAPQNGIPRPACRGTLAKELAGAIGGQDFDRKRRWPFSEDSCPKRQRALATAH